MPTYACDHHYTHYRNHTLGRIHVSWIPADLGSTVSHRTPSICARAHVSHLIVRGTELCESLKSTSHVSVCSTKTRSLVCDLHQTRFRETISCVDTWCCEAFVVEHSLIVRIKIQHIKFSCEYEQTFGIISFTQLNLFMVLVHFRSRLTSAHSTCISDSRSDNSCVTSLTQFATSVCIRLTIINVSAHLFYSLLPPENRNAVALAIHELIDKLSCGSQLWPLCSSLWPLLWPPTTQLSCPHIFRFKREYTHCIKNYRTVQSSIEPTRRSILELLSLNSATFFRLVVSRDLIHRNFVKAIMHQCSGYCITFNFTREPLVFGIRVRQTSVSFQRSVCNSEPFSTLYFNSLISSSFRNPSISCIIWSISVGNFVSPLVLVNFGLRQLSFSL